MELIALKIFIGLIVGTLIGLTGLGGGVLLLPLLIFGLRVPAIIAVGSDAAFNFLTKIPSSVVHLRKGTVRRKVVLALASGSIPGSILGVRLLQQLGPLRQILCAVVSAANALLRMGETGLDHIGVHLPLIRPRAETCAQSMWGLPCVESCAMYQCEKRSAGQVAPLAKSREYQRIVVGRLAQRSR